jgi:hypothetical protein
MAAVTEYHYPADKLTYKAAAAITGGNMVAANGNNREVVVAGADSVACMGMAMVDAASGALVSVASKGVWPIKAAGAINAGDRVKCAAAGAVAAIAADGDPRLVVGIALEDIANGVSGRVKLTNLG